MAAEAVVLSVMAAAALAILAVLAVVATAATVAVEAVAVAAVAVAQKVPGLSAAPEEIRASRESREEVEVFGPVQDHPEKIPGPPRLREDLETRELLGSDGDSLCFVETGFYIAGETVSEAWRRNTQTQYTLIDTAGWLGSVSRYEPAESGGVFTCIHLLKTGSCEYVTSTWVIICSTNSRYIFGVSI